MTARTETWGRWAVTATFTPIGMRVFGRCPDCSQVCQQDTHIDPSTDLRLLPDVLEDAAGQLIDGHTCKGAA